jgi:glucosamine kinase
LANRIGRKKSMLAVAATFGETVARRIVNEAAADLAVLVRTVNSALGQSARDLPVMLGGGVLVHEPLLQDAVRQALVADGLTDLRPLDRDPAHGALFLAKRLTAASVSETDRPRPAHSSEPRIFNPVLVMSHQQRQ